MKKYRVIVLFYCFSSIAQAELVSDKRDNQVRNINLEILLESAPVEAQRKLLLSKKKLKQQLEQLYLREALATMAIDEGLDKQGLNAERLKSKRDEALYFLKLDALRKSNKRDYSKYAKQIYLVNQVDYTVEESANAAHILISTKYLSDSEAFDKAKRLRQQLMQGENFSDLALKESDDSSVKVNQGELGTFIRPQMVKNFSDTVFLMQAGELSEPVKTQYGYHIIKLNKKRAAGFKSFEEVKASIINKLETKDWEKARRKFFAQVKEENEMKIDEQAIDDFVVKKLAELKAKK